MPRPVGDEVQGLAVAGPDGRHVEGAVARDVPELAGGHVDEADVAEAAGAPHAVRDGAAVGREARGVDLLEALAGREIAAVLELALGRQVGDLEEGGAPRVDGEDDAAPVGADVGVLRALADGEPAAGALLALRRALAAGRMKRSSRE